MPRHRRLNIPGAVRHVITRGLICYLGYYHLGINWKELARYFGISLPPVSQAIKRGEKFAKENDVKLLS